MKKLPKGLANRARETGEVIARDDFTALLNPKYRGANWDWSRFVSHVTWRAQIYSLKYTQAEWDKWSDLLREAQGHAAKNVAELLLRDSGLLEWWPNPVAAEMGG